MSDSLLQEMIGATKLGLIDLDKVLRTAPKRYKVYEIDKRKGGKRIIAHPSKELKILQRLLLDSRLASLPVHPKAFAYVVGKSIRDNAKVHTRKKFILKLDFVNFFSSLKVEDWDRYVNLKKCRLKLDPEDKLTVRQILFWGEGGMTPRCLSIGAPTSPILSNILMRKFDVKVSNVVKDLRVDYTRYADDITLSSDNLEALLEVEGMINLLVTRQKWPRLKLNPEKRGLYAKGVRQMVTGLVVTPVGAVSIGRQRKRLIHAMMHGFVNNRLDLAGMKKLQGFIGFCIANEPEFVESLKKKYGVRNFRRAQTRK